MRDSEYDKLLTHWKELTDNLISVNTSLRELVAAQQETIIQLQTVQVTPPMQDKILRGGGLTARK